MNNKKFVTSFNNFIVFALTSKVLEPCSCDGLFDAINLMTAQQNEELEEFIIMAIPNSYVDNT